MSIIPLIFLFPSFILLFPFFYLLFLFLQISFLSLYYLSPVRGWHDPFPFTHDPPSAQSTLIRLAYAVGAPSLTPAAPYSPAPTSPSPSISTRSAPPASNLTQGSGNFVVIVAKWRANLAND
jgi:hypothetical protein